MSGGIDSSVTAALLARHNQFDLEGVFMRNWDNSDDDSPGKGPDWSGGCQWKRDWEDVQRVCKMLGISARMVRISLRLFASFSRCQSLTWKECRSI